MRLQLVLTRNTQPVPFNHQQYLTGAIHKWLGQNDIHDGLSLYSFGWLRGPKATSQNLYFTDKVSWNVSFYNSQYAWQMARGILKDPTLMAGMEVKNVLEEPIPAFESVARFKTDGLVMARTKRPDGSKEYLFWDNPKAGTVLTGLLRQKLQKAGFGPEHLTATVEFDQSYTAASKKSTLYRTTKHHGSICPVIVRGTPEAVQFAYLVGVGDLTGSGFGALL